MFANRIPYFQLALRILLLLAGEQWNSDIQYGILPGLHCWYCLPQQAPYGILWHIIDFPFSLGTPGLYILTVFITDFAVMQYAHKWSGIWLYAVCSLWVGLQAPYDIPVLWLCLAGLYKRPLVFLGPLAKLPFGSEVWGWQTWRFIFSEPHPVSDYQYYGLMGIVFLAVLLSKRKKSVKMGTKLITIDSP